MNKSAERHLDKAAGYVAKGEDHYRRAAAEIIAAHDEGATYVEVAAYLKRNEREIRRLVEWYHNPERGQTPLAVTGATDKRYVHGARQVLREAPLEQVERIISELPPERQQDVAAAAGHAYMKARQEYRETEQNVTPAERQERVAAGDKLTHKVTAWSDTMRLTSSLEIAHELMRELNASGEVTADLAKTITRLLAGIEEEHRVMRAMAGLSIDLDEVEA